MKTRGKLREEEGRTRKSYNEEGSEDLGLFQEELSFSKSRYLKTMPSETEVIIEKINPMPYPRKRVMPGKRPILLLPAVVVEILNQR